MAVKEGEKVQYAPDAIHFLDGIDHLKCLVLGMALKADANFENVVKAWNFVIDEVRDGNDGCRKGILVGATPSETVHSLSFHFLHSTPFPPLDLRACTSRRVSVEYGHRAAICQVLADDVVKRL